MTLTHRFVSLSMLGAMALAAAPLAGAQGIGQDLTDEQRQEIHAELEACRDNNESHEDRKACAEAVFSNAGIERPERGPRINKGRKIGHKFHSSIEESCGERENTEQWRECAKGTRKDTLGTMREEHPRAARGFAMRRRFRNLDEETREELKACRQLDTREEVRACFDEVRDNLDTE